MHRLACRRRGIHPDLAVNDTGRKGAHVVSKGIERTTARQVKAGVVPVAGENAVFNRPSIQWESHMRTAVIDGIHVTIVIIDGNGMAAAGHHHTAVLPELSQGPHSDEIVNSLGRP